MIWTGIITQICTGWFCFSPWVYHKEITAASFDECIERVAEFAWKQGLYPERHTINCKPFERRLYTVK